MNRRLYEYRVVGSRVERRARGSSNHWTYYGGRSMNPTNIAIVEEEARKLLTRIKALRDSEDWPKDKTQTWLSYPSRRAAAVRRQSIELTHALANMRKAI